MNTAMTEVRSYRFGILGPVVACDSVRFMELGAPRQRAVLAALLVTPGRVVSVDRIMFALWEERCPSNAMISLQSYVSNLRRILEADSPPRRRDRILRRQPPGYVLAIEPTQVDAHLFEQAVRAGRRLAGERKFESAIRMLDGGLMLWRGSPYEEFGSHRFVGQEIIRLEDLRLTALEIRCEAQLSLGYELDAVIAELHRQWATSPTRERLSSLLMLALCRNGRQADALSVFERTRMALQEEFGVDPGAQLQNLFTSILRQDDTIFDSTPLRATEQ